MEPIRVDSRVGSRHLLDDLQGLPLVSCILLSGDVAWRGRGPADLPWPVGVELKRAGDFAQSMHTGRLTGYQMPRMAQNYSTRVLIVEGPFRLGHPYVEGERGPVLDAAGQPCETQRWLGWLQSLRALAGLDVWTTQSREETALLLRGLYHWWTHKPWEEHQSHVAEHEPLIVGRPGLPYRWALQCQGVGTGKARLIARRFRSGREFANATAQEIADIRGIGGKTATLVEEEIRGNHN